MQGGGSKFESLQDLVESKRNLVDHFYNDTISQYHKSRTSLFAAFIEPEYTNWREEQRAWRESAALLNLSHHMPTLYVKGPDARKMLNYLGINSFGNLSSDRAKQYVVCSSTGHVIGECVLYYYGEDEGFELTSGMPALNWVRFHAETGGYNVNISFDATSPYNPAGKRKKYRFQLEGPNARKIMEEVVEDGWPDISFFHIAHVKVAGCRIQVLRHGMAGHAGAEISGPYDDMDLVCSTILKAGEKYGIKQVGTRAYYTTVLESGWMPYPLPGIYTDDALLTYRKWLPADSWEANAQLGGSLYSENIEDYYQMPWCMGYERVVKFDHDFIGRKSLEASVKRPRRTKRTLVWGQEDVARVFRSQFGDGPIYKSIELPTSYFGWPQADEVRSPDGELVGMSCHCGFLTSVREMVSLVSIDERFAETGTEVLVTWGEANGGSRKPHVEPHEQTKIRAIVAPVPYAKTAREKFRATI